MNLEIPLGTHHAEKFATLQTIKDAQVAAILNHPAIIEITQHDDELAAIQNIYLEAHTMLKQINNSSVG